MEPQLFDDAVDAQLARLAADAAAEEAAASAAPSGTSELTLFRRIEDVKRRQRSQAVQVRAACAVGARTTAVRLRWRGATRWPRWRRFPMLLRFSVAFSFLHADSSMHTPHQDLMYFSVMRKFVTIGVDLLPPLARAPCVARLRARTAQHHASDPFFFASRARASSPPFLPAGRLQH
jgi:hypothetical protein